MVKLAGAAALYAQDVLKGGVVPNETVKQVGTAGGELVGNDPERVLILIYNLSNSEVTLSFNQGVSLGGGLIIAPNGGFMELDVVEDFILVSHAIYAISGSDARDVLVITMRRESEFLGGA